MNPRFHSQATVARPLRRSPSDARLVELARGGSEPAFEAIVARYRLPLVRHCARLVGEADAEDAAQDALVNAHAALLRGAAVRELAPWLYAIAQNAARSCLRARAARPAIAEAAGDRGVLAHGSAEGRQELRDVLAAVSSLPDRQRDAIVMRELEGRSYDEIASRLGASHGAVRQLLNRARGSVRDRIRALVPVEPFVRWALSRSNGATAAGGATLSGACLLGAKVCVVALLPATVALVPSPPTPRHETVTGSARPATQRIHVRAAATRSGAPRRATNTTLAVRPISSRASTHGRRLAAGERTGDRANTPVRARPSRRVSPAKGRRSAPRAAATDLTQAGHQPTNPPDTPTNPQPPAASSDPHPLRAPSHEPPPVIASREQWAVGPGPTQPPLSRGNGTRPGRSGTGGQRSSATSGRGNGSDRAGGGGSRTADTKALTPSADQPISEAPDSGQHVRSPSTSPVGGDNSLGRVAPGASPSSGAQPTTRTGTRSVGSGVQGGGRGRSGAVTAPDRQPPM